MTDDIQSQFDQVIAASGHTQYQLAQLWGAENDKIFATNQATLSTWLNKGLPKPILSFVSLLNALGCELRIVRKDRPRLWLLESDDTSWGEMRACVVRARTELEARTIIRNAEEGLNKRPYGWLELEFASCVEVPEDGKSEIILTDIFGG